MRISRYGVMVAVLLLALAVPALAQETIGSVKTLTGTAKILRGENVIPATVGVDLCASDVITTGPQGTVGIILRDDSLFSLGPDSVLELKQFMFEPKDGEFALGAKFLYGSFSYLTGKIGKLAPKAVKIETPSGTIAIRGTHLAVEVKK